MESQSWTRLSYRGWAIARINDKPVRAHDVTMNRFLKQSVVLAAVKL